MWEKSKYALAVLLIVAFIAASISIFAGRASLPISQSKEDPFVDDRVATVRLVMEEEDWSYCREHAFEERYVPADFWWDDELVPDVGFRTKGNSSLGQAVGWGNPRMPFAVDFNIFNRARTFHGVKKVFLNNGWSDPTLIREMIAYKVFARYGYSHPPCLSYRPLGK